MRRRVTGIQRRWLCRVQHKTCLFCHPHGNTLSFAFCRVFPCGWQDKHVLVGYLYFLPKALRDLSLFFFVENRLWKWKKSPFAQNILLIDWSSKRSWLSKNLIDCQKISSITKKCWLPKMSHFVKNVFFCQKITSNGCSKFSEFSEILDHFGSFLVKVISLSLSLSLSL